MSENQETEMYHYLAVSPVYWEAADEIRGCLTAVHDATKGCVVKGSKFSISLWRVPGNVKWPYRIENWEPQVKGAVKLFSEENGRL